MLGPGTAITHAAVRTLVDCGCSLLWVGEQGVRLYAQGLGETRSASNLLRQAQLCADPSARLRVVERMYRIRFTEQIGLNLSLPPGTFVYDIADLYKMDLTVPIAFRAVQASPDHLERRVRRASREAFQPAVCSNESWRTSSGLFSGRRRAGSPSPWITNSR